MFCFSVAYGRGVKISSSKNLYRQKSGKELTRQVSLILSIWSGVLTYRLIYVRKSNKKNKDNVQFDLTQIIYCAF